MSVATRIFTRPALKSPSARTRWPWLLLPWIAAALMPSLPSCSARRLAPCLVRVNTSAWSIRPGRDEVREQLALAVAVDRDHDLLDELGGRVPRRHLDAGGLVEQARGEAADVVRERRREQQVLPAGRQQVDDLADVADEAHVEEAVRLVEDEDLDAREVDGPLADVVEQAAGRGDHDLGAGTQLGGLRLEADAAVDRGRPDRAVLAVGPDALLDLDGELAGRDDDEDADGRAGGGRGRSAALLRREVARGLAEARLVQDLDDGEDEGRGLAGAGLGAGEQVAALEDQRDRLALDRGGLGVALVGDRAKQLGREPEGIEGHEGKRS